MAEQLFPVFEIPTITQRQEEEKQYVFLPGPLFDFVSGDFALDGAHQFTMVDGLDQYMIWCLKTLQTQRGACAAYPEYGVDSHGALSEASHGAVCSAFERTITEALMRNPRTERVYGFDFAWNADSLAIVFIVKPQGFDAFDITMNVVT